MRFVTPYQTTVGSGFVITKAEQAIKEAIVKTDFALINSKEPSIDLYHNDQGVIASVVTNATAEEQALPFFSHPMLIDFRDSRIQNNRVFMVGDARAFLYSEKVNSNTGVIIRNSVDFNFVKLRTQLSAIWYSGQYADFKYLSPTLMAMYSSWISENLTRRFALEAEDQLKIAIISAFFYAALFEEEVNLTEQAKQKLTGYIASFTHTNANYVFGIADQIKAFTGIESLCDAIKEILENPRLEDLNVGSFISVISSSWAGSNKLEIAAVAVEHIPTWICLVYSSFIDKTYAKTPLGRITERYRGVKGEQEIIRGMKLLLNRNRN